VHDTTFSETLGNNHPTAENGGDEAVAKRVGADSLGDAGPSGEALDHTIGGVSIHPSTVGAQEDGTADALPM
jgi:hypothetical protein